MRSNNSYFFENVFGENKLQFYIRKNKNHYFLSQERDLIINKCNRKSSLLFRIFCRKNLNNIRKISFNPLLIFRAGIFIKRKFKKRNYFIKAIFNQEYIYQIILYSATIFTDLNKFLRGLWIC